MGKIKTKKWGSAVCFIAYACRRRAAEIDKVNYDDDNDYDNWMNGQKRNDIPWLLLSPFFFFFLLFIYIYIYIFTYLYIYIYMSLVSLCSFALDSKQIRVCITREMMNEREKLREHMST